MWRRAVVAILLIGLALGAAVLVMTRPRALPAAQFAGLAGDAARGEAVFHAAGCASCHIAPEAVEQAEMSAAPVLSGGQRFETAFGTFLAPNISPDPEAGIGGWTLPQFASAVMRGVSPEGAHYYPAFPYVAYSHMTREDVADLYAFFATLPASEAESRPHELGFPFNIRATLGVWKALNLDTGWVLEEAETEQIARGRYLVEGLGHCAECHTPRNALGGLDRARWLAGAPAPSGEGRIPAIAPSGLDWAAEDIAYYLETGFTPEFDSAGGHMALVVQNYARLPAEDRAAVAGYLKALPF
ncbi:c-type cytochrome [Poseidonocella sedimentorum]|uniref:Cytochrome c, mono-and diheme variants n=1 Tax=Poseidonocella sedimentorum TaxID=871652 RepID=A0A1I6E9R1_9RHOB|nr:cytochrome c [Poseidonocella sedimentorum]SFR14238.1 Cytochrome c, mono-and diheme variants [Poseidonocella sedimentorum]